MANQHEVQPKAEESEALWIRHLNDVLLNMAKTLENIPKNQTNLDYMVYFKSKMLFHIDFGVMCLC